MPEPDAGATTWTVRTPPAGPPTDLPTPAHTTPPPGPPLSPPVAPPVAPAPWGNGPDPRAGGPRGARRLVAVTLVAAIAGGASGAVAGRVMEDRSAPVPASAVGVAVSGGATRTSDVEIARGDTGLVDVPAIAEALGPSVVSIEVSSTVPGRFGRSVTTQGAGTGFVMTSDGQIATNAHVVAGATTITVVTADGSRLPAEVVGIDSSEDLAVIAVDRNDLTPVRIGSSDELRVGESVVAMGNALALEGGPTVSMGIVSALGRRLSVENATYRDLIQTDAAISSGNSGGPLVDAGGRVIGINSAAAAAANAENIGFAIAIDHALPILRTLGARV